MLDECTNRIGVAGQSMLALPDEQLLLSAARRVLWGMEYAVLEIDSSSAVGISGYCYERDGSKGN